MTTALRAALASLKDERPEHAGLWLDRFCPDLARAEEEKPRLFRVACAVQEPALYKLHFGVWKQALLDGGARLAEAWVGSGEGGQRVPGRLVVGLGGESVLETSITLHRTYGVPMIPGSALKGVASSYAHRRLEDAAWREGGRAHLAAFGTTDQAGCLIFHDALYLPESGHARRALHEDVLTVHHAGYYQGKDATAPADWDSPVPVHFLTSTGCYLVAVSGPPLWTQKALEILTLALAEEGVGGKTSRGYGRLSLKPLAQPKAPTGFQEAMPTEFQSVARLKGLAAKDVRGLIGGFVQQWKNLAPGPEKKALAQAILGRVAEVGWKDAASKPWYQELQAFVEGN